MRSAVILFVGILVTPMVVVSQTHDEHIDEAIARHHHSTPKCHLGAQLPPPLSECAENSARYYSQFKEDAELEKKYFPCQDRGFFVELGGFTGIALSNSKHFEDKGWRGILFEGFPPNFAQCVKNRPQAATVGRAICTNFSTIEFVGNSEVLQSFPISAAIVTNRRGRTPTYVGTYLGLLSPEVGCPSDVYQEFFGARPMLNA
jgi:hypothetical protein